MKLGIARSRWLASNGVRLDASPYTGGSSMLRGTQGKDFISQRLSELTLNGTAGIFNGPRFSRVYVRDASAGIPFLGSTDILAADFRHLPLISRSIVDRHPGIKISEGWILVTCSGTTGRVAYARPDMDGFAGSQHFLRIVPHPDLIDPGYLCAYLMSSIGNEQLTALTYGAIVQHLEPSHVKDVFVAVPSRSTQAEIGALVREAARLRSDANKQLNDKIEELEVSAGLPSLSSDRVALESQVTIVSSNRLEGRLDATYHSQFHRAARFPLEDRYPNGSKKVCEYADIVESPRFKRIAGAGVDSGIPFLPTGVLHHCNPEPSFYLFSDSDYERYRVSQSTVLVPRSGQVGGIIGDVILPHSSMLRAAISEDAIRVHCRDSLDAGFLYLSLCSEYGRRQLKASAFGSSIPHLNSYAVGSVLIPEVSVEQLEALGNAGRDVSRARTLATMKEQEAIRLVMEAVK